MFKNPARGDIGQLLRSIRRIAVVGLSPNPGRPSHAVAKRMMALGYEIVPVRPAVKEILGRPAYGSLQDVPGRIDLVDVFRASDQVGPIVDACITLGIAALWLQDGVVNAPAAIRARNAGIMVIMDRCIWRDAHDLGIATVGE